MLSRQHIVQENDYYPFGSTFRSVSSSSNRYMREGKEYVSDHDWNKHDYTGRYFSLDIDCRSLSIDPMAEKFYHLSPYSLFANNPMRFIDPTGMAWEPTFVDNVLSGYQWIPESESYNADGMLLNGLYNQAIFFTHNGTFDANSGNNIGSSTAVVYLADGTTQNFDAATYPSNNNYATVPEGGYEAMVGTHYGTTSQYTALRMADVGSTDFGPGNNTIELGYPNPAYTDGRTHATGINIHKAGDNNLTGMTQSGNPVSAGCMLIDRNNWDSFIGIFDTTTQQNNRVSVTISRTYATPLNQNRTTMPIAPSLPFVPLR